MNWYNYVIIFYAKFLFPLVYLYVFVNDTNVRLFVKNCVRYLKQQEPYSE